MGTLFDQSPRQETIDSCVHTIRSIARGAGFDVEMIAVSQKTSH
jgi:hypothetical protein